MSRVAAEMPLAGIRVLAERFDEVLDRAYGSAAAVAANKDLHFALYRAAGSPALMEVITMLWLKAGPIINFDIGVEAGVPQEEEMTRSRGHHSREHHRMLCEALTARDGEAAAHAISEDIRTASELIRAELFERLGQELPYSCAVTIARYKNLRTRDRIEAHIHVERGSQKGKVPSNNPSR